MEATPSEPLNPHAKLYWLFSRGRHELALDEAAAILSRDPHDAYAFRLRGLSLDALRRFEEAEAAVREAVGLTPEDPDAHYALAYVLESRDALPGAKAALDEALRLDPTHVRSHHLKGLVATRKADWSLALACTDAGLAHDPDHVGCLALSAQALRRLRRPHDAAARARQALALDPENAYAHLTLGWILVHMQAYDEARPHFEASLRLAPSTDYAREGLLTTLRARWAPYRWVLAAERATERLTRWGWVALGLAGAAALYGAIELAPPAVGGLMILGGMAAFVAYRSCSYMAAPLANAALRLTPGGRRILRPHQVLGADLLLALLACVAGLTAIVACTLGAADEPWFVGLAYVDLVCFSLIFPVGITFERAEPRKRLVMGGLFAFLAVAAFFPPLLIRHDLAVGVTAGLVYFLAIWLFTLMADGDDSHGHGT